MMALESARSQVGSRWEWTDQKREALALLATGGRTFQMVADRVRIHRDTLHEWRRTPEFRQVLDELNQAIAEEVAVFTISRKRDRIEQKQHRWEAFQRIIIEKRREANEGGGQGLDTGFVVKRYKSIGSGPAAYAEVELEFDAPLARAFDALEKSAAEELGQLTTNINAEIGVHAGPPSVVRIHDQPPMPYTASREGIDPPGKYEQAEDGRWYDVETGEPFSFDPESD